MADALPSSSLCLALCHLDAKVLTPVCHLKLLSVAAGFVVILLLFLLFLLSCCLVVVVFVFIFILFHSGCQCQAPSFCSVYSLVVSVACAAAKR